MESDLKLVFIIILLTISVQRCSSQDPSCDHSGVVEANRAYYIYSPGYPGLYKPGVSCRWIAICPDNHNCRLQCTLQIPPTQDCLGDRLLISRSGDSGLVGADVYCANGTFQSISHKQRISIGLLTSQYSTGGRFACSLDAVAAAPTNTCSCGYKMTNRIVGGQETGAHEFPFMAGLLLDGSADRIECGAVIISERYVMTAAHCLVKQTASSLRVVVGEHNVNYPDPSTRQILKVAKIQIHPLFNENRFEHDVGVVATRADIRFSLRVGPVCLPFKFLSSAFAGAKVDVLGWGTVSPGGPSSPYLQKVTLDVISNQQCAAQVNHITGGQICTYTRGKDSCQNDSGGPLLYTDGATGLLFAVGIVSAGQDCASEYPAVATRVTSYIDWVVSVTPEVKYCNK